jgi:farnesyl diphosphate synthase
MNGRDLSSSWQEAICLINNHIDQLLVEKNSDSDLVAAMRYSALSKGKRIRPFLLMETAKIFDIDYNKSLAAATSIELIHCYSLIHDDLPAMDNDDFRRGIPTCHKKFDEATAILAGDALLTLAFEILSSPETHINPSIRCDLIFILAKSAGFKGMIAGQAIDIKTANQKIGKEEIARIHRLKTAELFIAAVESAAIIGAASQEEKKALRFFARDFGLAFQIKDDIADHLIDQKQVNQDQKNHIENSSIVDSIGIESAKNQLEMVKNQAIKHLDIFSEKAQILKELVNYL